MPLQVDNGASLNPKIPDVPTPDVGSEAVMGSPLDTTVKPTILNVKHKTQEGKLWCWAACIAMVLEYYQKSMSQCAIVRRKLQHDGEGVEPLCSPNEDQNLEDCDPRRVAQTWRDCGIDGVIPKDGHLPFDEIKAELKAGRPVEVGVLWNAGRGGHVVLIKGWAATSPESLVINDPLRRSPDSPDGSGRVAHHELVEGFGRGEWAYTWKNLA